MSDLIKFLLSVWHDEVLLYQGYFALFIAAILYLYYLKKRTKMEQGILCFSMTLILLFCFLPFVYMSISFFVEKEEYFHLLWLLPVLPVLGVVFVKYMETLKKKSQKCIGVLFCIFCVCFAGRCVYFQEGWYQQGYSSGNPYLEEQVEISVILDALDGNKVVVAHEDFLPIIRQISGDIKLLYGEDIDNNNYDTETEAIYELMKADDIDMEQLLERAEEKNITHLILAPQWNIQSKSLNELQLEGKLDIIYATAHYTLVKI